MPDKLKFSLLDRHKQPSRFEWINIDRDETRVGKVRAFMEGKTLTIYSINIFPEFERKGYAKAIVNAFKASFVEIIADRVRQTAIGFWLKMGFMHAGEGRYVYHSSKTRN